MHMPCETGMVCGSGQWGAAAWAGGGALPTLGGGQMDRMGRWQGRKAFSALWSEVSETSTPSPFPTLPKKWRSRHFLHFWGSPVACKSMGASPLLPLCPLLEHSETLFY